MNNDKYITVTQLTRYIKYKIDNVTGWNFDNFNNVSVNNTVTVSNNEQDAEIPISHEDTASWAPAPVDDWFKKDGRLTIKETSEIPGAEGDDEIQVAEYTLTIACGMESLNEWAIEDTLTSEPESRGFFQTADGVQLTITPMTNGVPGTPITVYATPDGNKWRYQFTPADAEKLKDCDHVCVTYYADAASCDNQEDSVTMRNNAVFGFRGFGESPFRGTRTAEKTLTTPHSTHGPNVYDLSSDYSSWITNAQIQIWDRSKDPSDWTNMTPGQADDYKDAKGHWDPEKLNGLLDARADEALKFDAWFTLPRDVELKPGDTITYKSQCRRIMFRIL